MIHCRISVVYVLEGEFMFCSNCGRELPEGPAFCRFCGANTSAVNGSHASVQSDRVKTPWEDRDNQGFVKGMLRTAKMAMFHPSLFFRKMPVTGGIADPLIFGMILGMFGLMFQFLWRIVLRNAMPGIMSPDMLQGLGLAVLAVLSPMMIVAVFIVSSASLHLLLKLAKGAHAGFEATFRVVAFAGSSSLLCVVPFFGNFIAVMWSIVLIIVGLREAHATSGGKAAFAVLFPLILFFVLISLLLIMLIGVAAFSLGTLFSY